MDHGRAPMLEALADYHERGRYGFTPPGHRQGRGVDARVLAVMGKEPFRDDVLVSAGLDDRTSSGRFLQSAEALMADAASVEFYPQHVR
jgi:arginine decarboxylase